MFEALHVWLEFFDDVADGLMVFHVVLDNEAEQFGFWVLFEDFISDSELYGLRVLGVEDGVDGLCWVRDKVVVVEVVDEVCEF